MLKVAVSIQIFAMLIFINGVTLFAQDYKTKKEIIIGIRAGLMINHFDQKASDKIFGSYVDARTSLINNYPDEQGMFPGGYMDIKPGFVAGLFAIMHLTKAIALQGEILNSPKGYNFYGMIGIKTSTERNLYKYSQYYELDYLELPLSIRFNIPWRISPYLSLGIAPAFRVTSNNSIVVETLSGSSLYKSTLENYNFPVVSSDTKIKSNLIDLGLIGAFGIQYRHRKYESLYFYFDLKLNQGVIGNKIDLQRGGQTHYNHFNELYSLGVGFNINYFKPSGSHNQN